MTKKKANQNTDAFLLYADSESDADLLYFGRLFVPDPFLAMSVRGRKIAVLNALEISRGRKESEFDEVLSLEELAEQAKNGRRRSRPGIADVVKLLAKRYRVRSFRVSEGFPFGLADALKKRRVGVRLSDGPLLPERAIKTDEEAAAIKEGNRCSAAGLRAARRILESSTIKNGKLYYSGKVLTSERVREEIDIACLKAGAIGSNTIVAGGDQACDPHCRGSGPLRANELIIVDVFPRVQKTGYYGDMTRTFLRGRASPEQKQLVATVRKAQKKALAAVRHGVTGRTIHGAVTKTFADSGYETRNTETGPVGFFHGTGHGLGLAVHEPPRVNRTGPKLVTGNVVTVEPGLYYPGLGGVRIEDVVRVQRKGIQTLSSFPYRWELR